MKSPIAVILPVLAALLAPRDVLAFDPTMQSKAAVEQRRERLREKREQQFRAGDLDRSRSLSRVEIEAAKLPDALLRRFSEIDADGDDALTPEELEAAQNRRIEAARDGAERPVDQRGSE
ncbi:MAG: hypothetical protein WC809_14720 [Sinimarinibacterium sp.]|jgi:hypothetical protein